VNRFKISQLQDVRIKTQSNNNHSLWHKMEPEAGPFRALGSCTLQQQQHQRRHCRYVYVKIMCEYKCRLNLSYTECSYVLDSATAAEGSGSNHCRDRSDRFFILLHGSWTTLSGW
jgi:hypothetical protein